MLQRLFAKSACIYYLRSPASAADPDWRLPGCKACGTLQGCKAAGGRLQGCKAAGCKAAGSRIALNCNHYISHFKLIKLSKAIKVVEIVQSIKIIN